MIRTRFAPSPTGFLHIGSLRTALYAYALAKHEKGDFILRIEDTDQKREVGGATEALQITLKRFGIVWDEFYVQSERQKSGIYEKAAKKLVEAGNAFYCQCKAKNAKEEGYSVNLRDICRDKNLKSGAIKLRVPDGETIGYHDFVHKKDISWNTNDVYDATLLKSDGFPTYHLAAMVDDIDMKISHILRGHDWLPSTPIHLLVFNYLAGKHPEIGHLSDILSASSGKKLSKRRDSVFCEQFIEDGFLPEALLNFVMLLGWAPKDNRELYSLKEFVENFDINGFQEANPKFLEEKLLWFNGYHIRQKGDKELLDLFTPFVSKPVDKSLLLKIIPLIKERINKLTDVNTFASFFFKKPEVDLSLFGKDYLKHLTSALKVLETICEDNWLANGIGNPLVERVKKEGYKTSDFFMDLRICLTGSKFTPPMNESMEILGKKEVVSRIKSILK